MIEKPKEVVSCPDTECDGWIIPEIGCQNGHINWDTWDKDVEKVLND